jgi:hypothetical protein
MSAEKIKKIRTIMTERNFSLCSVICNNGLTAQLTANNYK